MNKIVNFNGATRFIVMSVYRMGMRVLGCLRLSIQDIIFDLGNSATRHSFAKHPLMAGYGIHSIQELLDHNDVRTTMGFTHVLNKSGGRGILSPAGALGVGAPECIRAIEHPSCDIAEQAIEHPSESGVQLTQESMNQGRRRSSMPENRTTETCNTRST
jgi:hypothetical protein